MSFILRWIVTAIAVGVAVWLVPGIEVLDSQAWIGVILTALILSLVDIAIKPILQVLSLPITIITLGIFYLVVNTLLLYLAVWIANSIFGIGFDIASFGSGFVASIIISIVSTIANLFIGKKS